ncbi:MAG TPA: transposase [Candidatus Paceibacterota bacterium]|nr:transposase [Candidatus Paceibacterota bacterium]
MAPSGEESERDETQWGVYATTHWSVVLAAGGQDTPQSAAALEQLCRTYWYPLYAYVRRRGYGPEDAQDLTQEFFARLLAKQWVGMADPGRGRFRSFLLAALNHFLANEWHRGQSAKRGGAHPQLGYDALFAATAQALQDLAANPKRLGAQLGMLGVLHTWSRTLIYHPHLHYLVPGGGLSLDGQEWVAARRGFLLRVEPLSDHFRTGFRQWLEREAPEALAQIPAKVWKQRWVTHSQAAGSGEQVLQYLSRYVFKTATGNRAVPRLPDGRVRWPYRESAPGRWQSLVMSTEELIRRFLQHVLPAGFHRVRRFGWWHPAARAKREHVQRLLAGAAPGSTGEPALEPLVPDEGADPFDELERAETFVEAHTLPAAKGPMPPPLCPRCDRPMVCVARWHGGQHPVESARAPPTS